MVAAVVTAVAAVAVVVAVTVVMLVSCCCVVAAVVAAADAGLLTSDYRAACRVGKWIATCTHVHVSCGSFKIGTNKSGTKRIRTSGRKANGRRKRTEVETSGQNGTKFGTETSGRTETTLANGNETE